MKKFLFPRFSIEVERWKFNKALNVYVSNMGNIKNIDGKLQSVCKSNGYLYYKGKPIHRIVMQTWNPIPGYAYLTVDHLNHNTWDNRLKNLEWVTAEENKARDKEDISKNAPAPVEKKEIGYVLLNGAKVEITAARTIMYNDKAIGNARSQIDKLFNQIENGANEGKYGNYTLKKVA